MMYIIYVGYRGCLQKQLLKNTLFETLGGVESKKDLEN